MIRFEPIKPKDAKATTGEPPSWIQWPHRQFSHAYKVIEDDVLVGFAFKHKPRMWYGCTLPGSVWHGSFGTLRQAGRRVAPGVVELPDA